MPSVIQLRRGTAAQWALANTVLAPGEVGVETDAHPMKVKIGDGLTAWSALSYLGVQGISILAVADPLLFDPISGTLSVNVNEIIDGSNF